MGSLCFSLFLRYQPHHCVTTLSTSVCPLRDYSTRCGRSYRNSFCFAHIGIYDSFRIEKHTHLEKHCSFARLVFTPCVGCVVVPPFITIDMKRLVCRVSLLRLVRENDTLHNFRLRVCSSNTALKYRRRGFGDGSSPSSANHRELRPARHDVTGCNYSLAAAGLRSCLQWSSSTVHAGQTPTQDISVPGLIWLYRLYICTRCLCMFTLTPLTTSFR